MTMDASLSGEPEALIREAVGELTPAELKVPDDAVPMFEAKAIAAALVDRLGVVGWATPAFQALGAERHIDPELVGRVGRGARSQTMLVEVRGADGAVDTAVFAYASAGQAHTWRLPPELQRAARDAPDHIVVLTSQVRATAEPLEVACRAYGLTGLQTRVALLTIRMGNVKAAAASLGVSFHTAREALAEVMRRTHAQRLPAVVLKLTSLAFGVLPDENSADVLTDQWGLSPRQAGIAGLIAGGLSRAQAARALGLSEAVVKKELDQAYQVLQVGSAAALARKLVEANALHWLMRATRGDMGFVEDGAEPLQFVHRPDGGRIAVSDYGPASGRPVLVVHSSLTSRSVSRALIRALHGAGYRPISIDRPGFGMTDEVSDLQARRRDPYPAAAADALRVLDRLNIRAIDVVARGAARLVLELQAAAPDRMDRVVLVNPGLHAAADRRGGGLVGSLKEAYRRNPAVIRLWITQVSRHMTYDRYKQLMKRWVQGSSPDEAAVEDPGISHDYFISQRMFATGRVAGYVSEHTEYLRGQRLEPVPQTCNWQVMVAAHDTLHDPADVLAYWRDVLPDASFRVIEDAGRLLAMSHPHYVIEALQESA